MSNTSVWKIRNMETIPFLLSTIIVLSKIKQVLEGTLTLLSFKCLSLYVETSSSYELIIIQFSASYPLVLIPTTLYLSHITSNLRSVPMFVIAIMFCTEFVPMYMNYRYVKFHMPGSNFLSTVTVKPNQTNFM
jgi:hypothetical protein